MGRKTKYGWENMESGDSFILETDKEGARKVYMAGYHYCRKHKPDHTIVRKVTANGFKFVLAKIEDAREIKEGLNKHPKKSPYHKRKECIGIFNQETCKLLTWTKSWPKAATYVRTKDTSKFRATIRTISRSPHRDSAYGYRLVYFIADSKMPDHAIEKVLVYMASRKFLASNMRKVIEDPRQLNKISMDALRICINTLEYEKTYGSPPEYFEGENHVKSK